MIWSAIAAIVATLGAVHVAVWLHDRKAWANLMFSMSAFGVSIVALSELALMHTDSIPRFAAIMRWGQVAIFLMQTGIVMFVALHFGTGRRWMAWAATGLRFAVVGCGLFMRPVLQYRSIDSLKQVPFFGEKVWVVDVATRNPWQAFGTLSGLLAMAFVADASVALWRKGGVEARRRAVFVGASIVFYFAVAVLSSVLILAGVLKLPFLISFPFLAIVLTLGAELSRDVIRAARTAEELQESLVLQRQMHDRFRLSVEASPSGMILANVEGLIVLVNERATKMFGYDEGELLGKSIEELVPERFRGGHAGERRRFHGAPTTRAMGAGRDLFARRKDGSEFPVEIGLNPIDSAEGMLVLSVVVDISALRQAQTEAARQREDLAHVARVASLNELSGSLAHELNQPLAIILSNAQAAQRLMAQPVPDLVEVRDILNDIVTEDQRAGEVIKRLRALMKRGEVAPMPISLHDALEDVMRLLNTDLVARGVTVARELADDLPRVLGDRVQLQQVVINLVTNGAEAMAATEPGGRCLHIATSRRNGDVRLSVRDHGCGLPADVERLFAPFHTTKAHGLGMGLAICRTILDAHHGRLWAEPHEERGAVFHLELPAHSDKT